MECNDFCFPHLYTMNLVSSLQTRTVTNIWKIESILYLKYIILMFLWSRTQSYSNDEGTFMTD